MQRMWATTASYVTYESKVDLNIGKLSKENYSIQKNLKTTYLEPSPFIKGELIFRNVPNRTGFIFFPQKGRVSWNRGQREVAGFPLFEDWGDPLSINQKIDLTSYAPFRFTAKKKSLRNVLKSILLHRMDLILLKLMSRSINSTSNFWKADTLWT